MFFVTFNLSTSKVNSTKIFKAKQAKTAYRKGSFVLDYLYSSVYSQPKSRVNDIFEIWTEFWNLHVSF